MILQTYVLDLLSTYLSCIYLINVSLHQVWVGKLPLLLLLLLWAWGALSDPWVDGWDGAASCTAFISWGWWGGGGLWIVVVSDKTLASECCHVAYLVILDTWIYIHLPIACWDTCCFWHVEFRGTVGNLTITTVSMASIPGTDVLPWLSFAGVLDELTQSCMHSGIVALWISGFPWGEVADAVTCWEEGKAAIHIITNSYMWVSPVELVSYAHCP